MKKWTITDNCIIYKVLSGFFNVYLIQNHGEFLLIDTGHRKSLADLERNLKKIIGNQKINYLILTHTHYDHCGNAASIKKAHGSKIIVSNKETEYLRNGSTPLPRGTNFFTYTLSRLGNKYAISRYIYHSVLPDIEILDSYFVNDNIKIISTPGHSKGSLTVVVKDQIAIVGDVLFGAKIGSVFPHFADDEVLLLETWKKLLDNTKCYAFLPGHGKLVSRYRFEKEVSKRIKNI